MGQHKLNIAGNLIKYKLDRFGNTMGRELPSLKNISTGEYLMPDYEYVKQQLADQEGCKVKGDFSISTVRLYNT
jgi:hypothetical protein